MHVIPVIRARRYAKLAWLGGSIAVQSVLYVLTAAATIAIALAQVLLATLAVGLLVALLINLL